MNEAPVEPQNRERASLAGEVESIPAHQIKDSPSWGVFDLVNEMEGFEQSGNE